MTVYKTMQPLYLLLFVFILTSRECETKYPLYLIKPYVGLLIQVQQFYCTRGVYIIHDNYHLEEDWFSALIRQSSRVGIAAQAISLDQLDKYYYYYSLETVQPLFTVFIKTEENVHAFMAITKRYNISNYTWLVIFLEFNLRANNTVGCDNPQGNPFNLRFNTLFLVTCGSRRILREWYSVRPNQTETYDLAEWTTGGRVSFARSKNKHLYQRRNLDGIEIEYAKPSEDIMPATDNIPIYFNFILRELGQLLNFTSVQVGEDNEFGIFDSTTQKWTGLIGRLMNHEFDLAVGGFTMSTKRLSVVDFGWPLLTAPSYIYVKLPERYKMIWTSYFMVFHYLVWLTIGASLLVAAILLTFTSIKYNHRYLSINWFFEYLFRVWGIYCQQSLTEFPSPSPMKMIYFTVFYTCILISSLYSGSITSYLALLTYELPFYNIETFVKDGSYKLIVFQNSQSYVDITSGYNPVLHLLKPLLKNIADLPNYAYDGFVQVCSENVGFYLNEADVVSAGIHKMPCILAKIPTGQSESITFAFSKDSQYQEAFSYYIRQLDGNYLLEGLRRRYFTSNIVDTYQQTVSTDIARIYPLLVIVILGVYVSIVIFIIEHVHYRHHQKRFKKRSKVVTNDSWLKNFSKESISVKFYIRSPNVRTYLK